MNTIQETDSGVVRSRRGLGSVAAAVVIGALGIAVGADFGGPATPMLATDAGIRDQGRVAAPAAAPARSVGEPMDPELLRLDRANEHHG